MTRQPRRTARTLLAFGAGVAWIGATVFAGGGTAHGNEVIPGLSATIVGDFPTTAAPNEPYGLLASASSLIGTVDDVTWSLGVTQERLTTSSAVDDFLADPAAHELSPVLTAASAPSGATPSGTIAMGGTATTSLTTGTAGLGLPADAPGVYGVVATLWVEGEEVWSKAAPVTWNPAALPRLDVAVVVAVTGTPERVESVLTAASDRRVTLLVDPDALSDDQLAEMSGRRVFALPAGNLDLTSVAHAGVPSLADAALERTATADLPWVAVAAVADQATARVASDRGAVAMLTDGRWSVSPTVSVGASGMATVGTTGETVPVVVADDQISGALATRAPSDAASPAVIVAQAAIAAASGKGVAVVAPGDGWVVDGTRPSRELDALWRAPFTGSTSLEEVIESAALGTMTLPESRNSATDAPADTVATIGSLLARLEVLQAAATQPSAMIDDASRGLFASLAVGDRADLERRAEEGEQAIARGLEVLDGVAVTSGSELTLVSSSGSVPIAVRNDLDVPVTVRVDLFSRSPSLLTKDKPEVTISPGATTTVTVPVEAVSNGDVAVSVALRTRDGATVSIADTVKVRVRAAWGTAATGLFAVGVAVILVAGVVRTIRRGRTDTRLVPTKDTVVAGAALDQD